MGWGAAIGAIGSLAGGLLSSKSASDQSAANYEMQKEFAKNGIRWKVADAKAAGIHPLAALGAQTASFAPIATGDYMGQAVADMGQNISRAIAAGQSKSERAAELERQTQVQAQAQARQAERDRLDVEKHKLDVTHMGLQNELLRSQIARFNSAQLGPGMPSASFPSRRAGGSVVADVTSPTGAVEVVPSEVISANPNASSVEAGVGPGWRKQRIGGDRFGVNYELPNSSMSEAMEALGSVPSSLATMGHNLLRAGEGVVYGPGTKGLPELPKTHYWKWNPFKQRYVVTKK